ncbi:MAG: hypothetical protein PHX83_03820 [Acidobacteriia bacterium]|nr:hypothetical protein [Terriglobia bacterium]
MNQPLTTRIKSTAVLAMLVLSVGSAHFSSYAQDRGCKQWQIIPGKCLGKINVGTNEADLVRIFGRGNVRREDLDIGEGGTVPGTVLYPEDNEKRVEIFWKNQQWQIPTEARIRGNASVWKTRKGISLGMSLKEIERLNGKPFRLYGFGWDGSGLWGDCDKGRLKEMRCEDSHGRGQGGEMSISFSPDPKWQASRTYYRVSGERIFSSGHPSMQTMNPRIYELSIYLQP